MIRARLTGSERAFARRTSASRERAGSASVEGDRRQAVPPCRGKAQRRDGQESVEMRDGNLNRPFGDVTTSETNAQVAVKRAGVERRMHQLREVPS